MCLKCSDTINSIHCMNKPEKFLSEFSYFPILCNSYCGVVFFSKFFLGYGRIKIFLSFTLAVMSDQGQNVISLPWFQCPNQFLLLNMVCWLHHGMYTWWLTCILCGDISLKINAPVQLCRSFYFVLSKFYSMPPEKHKKSMCVLCFDFVDLVCLSNLNKIPVSKWNKLPLVLFSANYSNVIMFLFSFCSFICVVCFRVKKSQKRDLLIEVKKVNKEG